MIQVFLDPKFLASEAAWTYLAAACIPRLIDAAHCQAVSHLTGWKCHNLGDINNAAEHSEQSARSGRDHISYRITRYSHMIAG